MFKKKSLGQNFLKSKTIAKDVVLSGKPEKDELILEIGPGEGFLTEEILKISDNVLLVEKDHRLIPLLEKKFENYIKNKKLKIIQKDILEFEISEKNLGTKKYKVIANIPYYITGSIIRKFLDTNLQPKEMILMVQKEVAERIMAKNGKESLLSLSVKIFGNPKIIKKVPRGAFSPPPKVDSAVIKIDNISKNKFREIDEKNFFQIIHAGFAHKRKQLFSNISSVFGKEKAQNVFNKLKINPKIRAEDLPMSLWIEITKNLV